MTVSDTTATDVLWSPTRLGRIGLAHRLAMAPMTRNRATHDGLVTDLTATYYVQRASLAMLITEGTQPSEDGQGYPATPGIYTEEQAEAWGRVADDVHAAGSTLVVQLMHAGRVSHPSNTAHGRAPLAPSAIAARGDIPTATGMQPMAEPREMTEADLAQTIADFRRAARLAVDAGADGVELHGANGYLLHQFMSSNANRRTDATAATSPAAFGSPWSWPPPSRRRSAPTGSGTASAPATSSATSRKRMSPSSTPRSSRLSHRSGSRTCISCISAMRPSSAASATDGPPGWYSTAPVPTSIVAHKTCATDWPMS